MLYLFRQIFQHVVQIFESLDRFLRLLQTSLKPLVYVMELVQYILVSGLTLLYHFHVLANEALREPSQEIEEV